MATDAQARACLANWLATYPELFPPTMSAGYSLHGWTQASVKMPDKRLRRIKLAAKDDTGRTLAYTIAPCDLLPYMSGMVSDVEKAIYLKKFGVPDYALTYVFGRNDSYWYRQTLAFGRYNLVGSTVKDADNLPEDLLADEKHVKAHGTTWYIGTTVAQDCVLGASVSTTADAVGLAEAYGVFKMEPMARWLADSRHFHGNLQSAELRMRSWALLHNYWLYCPRAKVSQSFQSPAHKLNGFVYRENWLENLLVASSCQGFRASHKIR